MYCSLLAFFKQTKTIAIMLLCYSVNSSLFRENLNMKWNLTPTSVLLKLT